MVIILDIVQCVVTSFYFCCAVLYIGLYIGKVPLVVDKLLLEILCAYCPLLRVVTIASVIRFYYVIATYIWSG